LIGILQLFLLFVLGFFIGLRSSIAHSFWLVFIAMADHFLTS
jgi:hypothetical protein